MSFTTLVVVGCLIGIGGVCSALAARAIGDKEFERYFWGAVAVSVLALMGLMAGVHV